MTRCPTLCCVYLRLSRVRVGMRPLWLVAGVECLFVCRRFTMSVEEQETQCHPSELFSHRTWAVVHGVSIGICNYLTVENVVLRLPKRHATCYSPCRKKTPWDWENIDIPPVRRSDDFERRKHRLRTKLKCEKCTWAAERVRLFETWNTLYAEEGGSLLLWNLGKLVAGCTATFQAKR
jgi:hypothetical protein